MRIAYILTSLDTGGAERQVISLARRMAARGHPVALLVLRSRSDDSLLSDLDVTYLDVRRSLLSGMRGYFVAVGWLRVFHPDIVHGHNFHGNMLARLLRLSHPQCRAISTIHNVFEGGALRMLGYRLTGRLARVTTAVCGAAAERYKRLKAVNPAHCVVITNGIEIADFVPDEQRRSLLRADMGLSDEFVWITVGRIAPAKDYPNLLKAFEQVWASDRRAQLWIVGDEAADRKGRASYSAFSMSQGPMDNVRWLGLRKDVAPLLDAADGFVLGSAWEGMPLALGEAMAMQKPVIATDVGGVRELCGEAGVLVPAKDPSALADAMLAVMNRTPDERAGMGKTARARISAMFTMDAKADEWEKLYRSVASQV